MTWPEAFFYGVLMASTVLGISALGCVWFVCITVLRLHGSERQGKAADR